METSEKRLEQDIESFFLSAAGGYTHTDEAYNSKDGLYTNILLDFIQKSQPQQWKKFVTVNKYNPEQSFVKAFNNACDDMGLLHVLRKGFKTKGAEFRVCFFMPASSLNQRSKELYKLNQLNCVRQWYYSSNNNNSVDMVLVLNGIPIVALELKNQFTGQNIINSRIQWQKDRNPKELCFNFNKRILCYFCVDQLEACMTTKLNGDNTVFLPFNQGSNGAGRDGGKGNTPNVEGYVTSYLWEDVLQKDKLMGILQKFIHLEKKSEQIYHKNGNVTVQNRETLIFPRYHQLDVVRKLINDVQENYKEGKNYLIQHSAGSGKSNSISWLCYRLGSLHNEFNAPIFDSVIIVTDRKVLDSQLQDTISSFEHVVGSVVTIGEHKTSQDLKNAINDGAKIIVTTLQKFSVIYKDIDSSEGKHYAIIVDEAHQSQTGNAALNLKAGLADITEALREYAELEGKKEEEIDKEDPLIREILAHGKHKNLFFFAFTATPKDKTLEIFGTRHEDGSFHPFHIYSMRQAIEEGYILDVLQNYMTYDTCCKIAKTTPDNPDVPASRAAKLIRQYENLHPYNIAQKSQIIAATFVDTTRNAINGKGKMMVVTSSRLAAVKYCMELRRLATANPEYESMKVLVAFSGTVKDTMTNDVEYTEEMLNLREDGTTIKEKQLKQEFHDNYNILVVAEKYQTGFDEPLLHTMIVDKELRSVKAVQTLSRLNRTCTGKTDTFILDFINTAENIEKAFQPFYQEIYLKEEVNTDRIYQTRNELRKYGIYDDTDVENLCEIYFKKNQTDKDLGKMTSSLLPVQNRYNEKDENTRYQFRRDLRKLIKWYGFISHIVRTFDAELHKEFVFCSYLLKLLPDETDVMADFTQSIRLEYYKLVNTFKGTIELEKNTKGEYKGSGEAPTKGKDKKTPLEEVIEKMNQQTGYDFTDADKIVTKTIYDKLSKNTKVTNMAKSSKNYNMFREAQFPPYFKEAAMEGYTESEEAYKSIFTDKAKYVAIQNFIAETLFRDTHQIT